MESEHQNSRPPESRIITALLKTEKYSRLGIYIGLIVMAFALAMPLLLGVK